MFSSFLEGWAGVGLILLRLVIALDMLMCGWQQLATSGQASPAATGRAFLLFLIGAAVLVGMLTPVVSGLAGIAFFSGFVLGLGGRLHSLEMGLLCFALMLLGPGAYSRDAQRYGLRTIVIPQGRRPPPLG